MSYFVNPYEPYVDSDGNFYTNFTSDGMIIPNGFHFKEPLSTSLVVIDIILLACFFAMTCAVCCIRSRGQNNTNDGKRYVRRGVIGISILLMFFVYMLLTYDRVNHELRRPMKWYYPAVIGVIASVLTGSAHGLLIAFLLWQLTPVLLMYGNASSQRIKRVIHFCRYLTLGIALADTADIIVVSMIWVLGVRKSYLDAVGAKIGSKEQKLTQVSNINDAALTSAFQGMYLICVLVFTGVAWVALKNLSRLNALHKRFKLFLPILSLSLILRSLLEFLWALVFKVGALYQEEKYEEGLKTIVLHTAIYGFLSVVVYISILVIASTPVPEGMDHNNVDIQHLPEDAQLWHQDGDQDGIREKDGSLVVKKPVPDNESQRNLAGAGYRGPANVNF